MNTQHYLADTSRESWSITFLELCNLRSLSLNFHHNTSGTHTHTFTHSHTRCPTHHHPAQALAHPSLRALLLQPSPPPLRVSRRARSQRPQSFQRRSTRIPPLPRRNTPLPPLPTSHIPSHPTPLQLHTPLRLLLPSSPPHRTSSTPSLSREPAKTRDSPTSIQNCKHRLHSSKASTILQTPKTSRPGNKHRNRE